MPQSKGCEVPLNTVLGSIPGPAIRQFSGTLRGKGRWGRLTLERQRPEGRSGKRPERRSGNGRSGGWQWPERRGAYYNQPPRRRVWGSCSLFSLRGCAGSCTILPLFSLETVVLLPSPGLSSQVVRSNFLGGPPLCAFEL